MEPQPCGLIRHGASGATFFAVQHCYTLSSKCSFVLFINFLIDGKACCYSLPVLCTVLLLSNVLSEACTACQSKKCGGTNLKFRYDKEKSRATLDLVIFHEVSCSKNSA